MTVSLCRDCDHFSKSALPVCPDCGSRRVIQNAELDSLDIAHIDCDAFYASVEKRDNPELRDKPLIIGHAGGRGVVTTACYIARKFGPRSAMPMFQALELCPDAVVIKPDMAKYKIASQQIREIFKTATHQIEPLSLDEAYLDLSGEYRRDPATPAVLLARIARQVEQDVGITVSIGLSDNKFLAKLASDLEKPRGFSVIGQAGRKEFLAPLSVRKILGVGKVTAARMQEEQIFTIGDLQLVPEARMVSLFGKFGRRLAQFAQGEDDRRVSTGRAAKSVSAETTFATNIRSADQLIDAAKPLCQRVAERLSRGGTAGGNVVLKLKTGDFRLLTRSLGLAHPTQRADTLLRAASQLIRKEIAPDNGRADGRANGAHGQDYRLIGIGVGNLTTASKADPPDLFDSL